MKDKLGKRNSIFTRIYYKHRERIYWYIRKKVASTELAEDIAAEVFMKLLENEDILLCKDAKRIQAWLYFVARNKVIDTYRKKESNVAKVRDSEDGELFDMLMVSEDGVLDDMIEREKYESVLAGLDGLDCTDREVITLRLMDDLKFSQIATVLEEEEGAVKMRYYRAIDKLKETVQRLGDKL